MIRVILNPTSPVNDGVFRERSVPEPWNEPLQKLVVPFPDKCSEHHEIKSAGQASCELIAFKNVLFWTCPSSYSCELSFFLDVLLFH